MTRLACDHLLWAAAYFRFVDPLGWEATRTGLLSRLPVPAPLRALAQRRFRAGALRKLKGQVSGRPAVRAGQAIVSRQRQQVAGR